MSLSKFCEQCGAPLKPTTRFCGNCGAQVQPQAVPPAMPPPSSSSSSSPPPPPPPAPLSVQEPVVAKPEPVVEPVIGVIPGLERSKSLVQTETFFLIVTPARLVFALITQAMINAAVNQARADAKARGEGILGQMGAQLAYLDVLAERCRAMPVEATLADQPGSFFIPNDQIRKVEIKPIDPRRDMTDYYLVIQAISCKYQFTLKSALPVETRELLQDVLGDVVE
jgi:hypothetical protein